MSRRIVRLTAPALFLVFALPLALPARGQDEKWEPTRTTVPESVEDLKALQDRVRHVVEKCTPSTVGVLIGMGAGSGVIVSEDGLVLTAAHVSGEPGNKCRIVLPDGKRVNGKTLGINEKMDSGMVQIVDKGPNNGKWPFLPIGKAADLKKGQWVVSLGHPGGPKEGRFPVARLGRVQTVAKDLLRTDCTLVGGDSGGPLFDLNGNVVGIHSRIGLSLAQNIHVPSDAFKTEWDQLAKGENIGKRVAAPVAYLGVTFDEKADTAKLLSVEEDGPAAEAGLKGGDVITRFNDSVVATADDIRGLLKKCKPGEEVELIVRRDEKKLSLTVKLGKRT